MSTTPYSAPVVTTLGTVQALTEQRFNKVGQTADQFAPSNVIVGSLVPVP